MASIRQQYSEILRARDDIQAQYRRIEQQRESAARERLRTTFEAAYPGLLSACQADGIRVEFDPAFVESHAGYKSAPFSALVFYRGSAPSGRQTWLGWDSETGDVRWPGAVYSKWSQQRLVEYLAEALFDADEREASHA